MHTASCFSTTPDRGSCLWPLQGPWSSPSPLLISFPLAPVGVWIDPPSLDQWTLPWESQTLGDRPWEI